MKNIIACNLNSYGKFSKSAYPHLAKIGLRNVEIAAPAPEDVDTVMAELQSHGLTATSIAAPCDVQNENVVSDFQACLEGRRTDRRKGDLHQCPPPEITIGRLSMND